MALISLKWLQVSFFPYVMHKMKILIYFTTYATHVNMHVHGLSDFFNYSQAFQKIMSVSHLFTAIVSK